MFRVAYVNDNGESDWLLINNSIAAAAIAYVTMGRATPHKPVQRKAVDLTPAQSNWLERKHLSGRTRQVVREVSEKQNGSIVLRGKASRDFWKGMDDTGTATTLRPIEGAGKGTKERTLEVTGVQTPCYNHPPADAPFLLAVTSEKGLKRNRKYAIEKGFREGIDFWVIRIRELRYFKSKNPAVFAPGMTIVNESAVRMGAKRSGRKRV